MNITDYCFGKITIGEKKFTTDVIILPDRIRDSWWRKEGHRLHIEDLDDILAAQPDILIIGTGFYGRMTIPDKTRKYLESKGIDVRSAPTGEAVKLFNELQKEYADIAAALHLTC